MQVWRGLPPPLRGHAEGYWGQQADQLPPPLTRWRLPRAHNTGQKLPAPQDGGCPELITQVRNYHLHSQDDGCPELIRQVRNYHLHSQDGGCPELITQVRNSVTHCVGALIHSWAMFQAFRVNSLILSAQFWPQFKTETVELPTEVPMGAFFISI
jgi:hypothetical protein